MVKLKFYYYPLAVAALVLLGCFFWPNWLLSLDHRLPLAQDKQQARLDLRIEQVEHQPQLQKITAKVLSSSLLQAQNLPELRYLRLNFYQPEPELKVGQQLQAQVVLRSPRNLSNGLAFDYEAWLLMQQVDATGYIKTIEHSLQSVRPSLRWRFIQSLKRQTAEEHWPWVAGLILGEQDAFSAEQWQLAKETGTLHLLVVSGMHLAMVVALCLLLWALLLRLLTVFMNRSVKSLLLLRLVFLLAASALYLWVAGAGIALQRAWVMLAVALLLYNSRVNLNWLSAIAVALAVVLLINPLVWLSAGFQYSFAAVLALLLFFLQRKNHKLEALWLPQIVVFLALLPLFVYWQQPVSLMQCLANLLAIPWFTFVLMPLTLLAIFVPDVGQLSLLSWAGEALWWWLNYAKNIPLSSIAYLPTGSALLWPLWLWVLLQGQGYWLARLALLTVLLVVFIAVPPQQPQATMLEVGQGQSLIFTTQQHTLVYDSGPYLGGFDSGEAIVRPALHKLAVRQIDRLIISHQDNDHSGGTQALLNAFAVEKLVAGEALPALTQAPILCSQLSSRWRVLDEQLSYRYLNVRAEAWQYLPDNHNNRSCVVQVDWYGVRFLLVGDIAKAVEYELIRTYGQALTADVLVLAHHGSKSSSSEVFLRQVAAQQVWISSGFNNRFNHPADEVLARLEQLGMTSYNTAQVGRIWLDKTGNVHAQRQKWQPPWRNQE